MVRFGAKIQKVWSYMNTELLIRFTLSKTWFSWNKISQDFLCLPWVSNRPSYAYLCQKMKIDAGFWPKHQISPIGKNFQEIGLKYKQIQVNGWNMAQNVSSGCRDIKNWSRGFKDISQKPHFWAWLIVALKICFMEKVGKKGNQWWDIGEGWRKVAQIG